MQTQCALLRQPVTAANLPIALRAGCRSSAHASYVKSPDTIGNFVSMSYPLNPRTSGVSRCELRPHPYLICAPLGVGYFLRDF